MVSQHQGIQGIRHRDVMARVALPPPPCPLPIPVSSGTLSEAALIEHKGAVPPHTSPPPCLEQHPGIYIFYSTPLCLPPFLPKTSVAFSVPALPALLALHICPCPCGLLSSEASRSCHDHQNRHRTAVSTCQLSSPQFSHPESFLTLPVLRNGS